MLTFRKISYALILLLFIQGCMPARTTETGQQVLEEAPTVNSPPPTAISTLPPAPTLVPTSEPSATPLPQVTITAVTGNLYIRRGPGLPYDRIGVLHKGESARIIGQDVLSRWVQIEMPGSDRTGWVSIMTDFSIVEGDLSSVPDFTFTEYPLPAYIKNCTEHDLWVEPANLYVYNLYANERGLNEIQVDPGTYYVYDMFVEKMPLVDTVDVREGTTAYITVNGLGERHKCP